MGARATRITFLPVQTRKKALSMSARSSGATRSPFREERPRSVASALGAQRPGMYLPAPCRGHPRAYLTKVAGLLVLRLDRASVNVRRITTLLECAFENPIVASAKARCCREDLGCTSMKHCTIQVCEWIASERIKQLRTSRDPSTSVEDLFPCRPAATTRPVMFVQPLSPRNKCISQNSDGRTPSGRVGRS